MRTSLVLGLTALLTLSIPPTAAPAKASTPARVTYRDAASAMLAAGAPYANWIHAGRHFLSFDAHGDGTAVEVLGDLATADRVAVLVPGVDTTLADFDRGLGGVARRAPAVQARSIFTQLHTDDPAARVAVVAWLGYDPPNGIGLDAIREARARAGASALIRFVRGVLAQRPAIGVTLIGHSYGAIVVGLAAPHLPEVADVVALGGPGMGASRASDLGGARVWSALAPGDWMRNVPQLRLLGLGHGRRPSSARFGAIPLPTAGVAGHDYYLVPGSATLEAVTEIVLGRSPRTATLSATAMAAEGTHAAAGALVASAR
jgi:pimeloyl-ACP methyl ester carboxylesterase